MTSSGQNGRKATSLAKSVAVSMTYGKFLRFLTVFCHIWHVYLLPIWQAFSANRATMLCKRQEAAPARLRFCGAWPSKTEPSGRRWRRCSRVFLVFSFSAFEWSFCLFAPCPPRSHLSTRATPPRAISPRLFNFPCRGRSDSASAGRVPAEAQFTTDKGVDGRSRVFFSPFSKCVTYAPQNDRSENTITRLFDFRATGSRFGEIALF